MTWVLLLLLIDVNDKVYLHHAIEQYPTQKECLLARDLIIARMEDVVGVIVEKKYQENTTAIRLDCVRGKITAEVEIEMIFLGDREKILDKP